MNIQHSMQFCHSLFSPVPLHICLSLSVQSSFFFLFFLSFCFTFNLLPFLFSTLFGSFGLFCLLTFFCCSFCVFHFKIFIFFSSLFRSLSYKPFYNFVVTSFVRNGDPYKYLMIKQAEIQLTYVYSKRFILKLPNTTHIHYK